MVMRCSWRGRGGGAAAGAAACGPGSPGDGDDDERGQTPAVSHPKTGSRRWSDQRVLAWSCDVDEVLSTYKRRH
jgi:hypothetical protein